MNTWTRDDYEFAIFDMARCNDSRWWPWTFIENIKNGIFMSTKYQGGIKIFDIPKVVMFMNVEPDMDKLSADRYDLMYIWSKTCYYFTINTWKKYYFLLWRNFIRGIGEVAEGEDNVHLKGVLRELAGLSRWVRSVELGQLGSKTSKGNGLSIIIFHPG